ncbi:MAG: EF-hand domain-containing protein [Saprospiraceae bacterium]
MNKQFVKMILVGMVVVLLAACSKKTAPVTNTDGTATTEQKRNRTERKGKPQFSELLTKMDANRDGKLSKAEVQGPLKNDFAKVDTNSDGFITEAEFKQMPTRKPRRQRN